MSNKKRTLTQARKRQIAGHQFYKCANKPNSRIKGLEDYNCPLWQKDNDKGCFDEAGYEIDHIIELNDGGSDDNSNLQALCKNCHTVKTKKYLSKPKNKNINVKPKKKENKKFNSSDSSDSSDEPIVDVVKNGAKVISSLINVFSK
jgi:5-methylcytosine-specific restriction endonuclease McrA